MKTMIYSLTLAALMITSFSSCSDDNDPVLTQKDWDGTSTYFASADAMKFDTYYKPHLPRRHGTGHIRMPAVHHRAEIHRDEIARLHHLVGGNPVGQRAVGTGHHDKVECHPLGTLPADAKFQLQRDLALGLTGADIADNMVKAVFGQRLCLTNTGDLLRRFAQPLRVQPFIQRRKK